jgi:anti-sigma factor RsiW
MTPPHPPDPGKRNPDEDESVGKFEIPDTTHEETLVNPHGDTHLNSELLQAMAEGELDPARMDPARAHLAGCGRCRAELEGWQLLFSELEDLPDLGPAMGFADRVMTRVEVRAPLPQRVADRLRSLVPSRSTPPGVRHLNVNGIHEYLDRQLGLRARQRVDEHLATCGRCRSEVEGWAPVFEGLQALPRFSPPQGFADAVMARVPVAAIAEVARSPEAVRSPEAAWTTRALDAASRLIPATRKGWAVVGGLVATPTVAMVAAVAAVVLHPLLSFEGLLTFARWRLADALGAGWLRALESFGGNPVVLRAWEVVSTLLQAPGMVAFGLVALWASVLAAAWVLYRHVIAPSFSTENHAKASS